MSKLFFPNTVFKRSSEDAGDGRVEDLGVRNNVEVEDQLTLSSSDDDGCELTIVSVESVIGTPSPVPSISRPSVIIANPRPSPTAVKKMSRKLQERSSPIIKPPGRPESEKEPVVITIDDSEEEEVKKEPLVAAQDDEGEEEPEAKSKRQKLYRDLLKNLPSGTTVIRNVTL